MKTAKILMLIAITGFSLLGVRSAWAANYIVKMYYYDPNPPNYTYAYVPATLTVEKGDTVTWSNADFYPYSHSSTSGTAPTPSGPWTSGTVNNGQTYTLDTSTISAGTYPYFCTFDYSLGMTGTLIITNPPSLPPAISITNPVSGAVFAAPATVTIQAAVTNGSGSVTNVQFLVGSGVVTNKTSAPYSATTNNLAAGSYTLTAIAKDNSGLTANNSVAISVVTPVTVSLTNSAVISGTNFQFSYLVNTGLSYVVQLSTNLVSANWIPLVTNLAASNPAVFVDPRATNKSAFYRVGRLPNP